MWNSVYFPVTENCNFSCGHCYLSAGPGKEDSTVSLGDFEDMICNLPRHHTEVILTGGEVTTIPDKLEGFLNVLNKKKEMFNRFGKTIAIGIQTNGSRAKDMDSANYWVDYFEKMGVGSVDITSVSKHHRAHGIDETVFDNLREVFCERRVRGHVPRDFSFRPNNEYFPMGRALDLGVSSSDIKVSYNGTMCARAVEMNDMSGGKIKSLIGKHGECGFCARVFGENGDLRLD